MKKIMESERLALIGQLAANVAHELNNPLQGIVTYSRLLLEKMPERGCRRGRSVQKIVNPGRPMQRHYSRAVGFFAAANTQQAPV